MKAIATKLSQVGAAIGWGVPKDGTNTSQGYDYTSAASVRMAVGPELAERKIAVSSQLEVISQDFPTAKSGAVHHRVVVRATLTFVDADSGETMTAQGLGSGMDSGDKSCMKAVTAAEKYAYVSAFTLAMGEDPERDAEHDRIAPSHGAEEAQRSREQSARGEHIDNERVKPARAGKALADGLVDHARANICDLDSLREWIRGNKSPVLALADEDERAPNYVLSRVGKHAVVTIEGMNKAGFLEEWNA